MNEWNESLQFKRLTPQLSCHTFSIRRVIDGNQRKQLIERKTNQAILFSILYASNQAILFSILYTSKQIDSILVLSNSILCCKPQTGGKNGEGIVVDMRSHHCDLEHSHRHKVDHKRVKIFDFNYIKYQTYLMKHMIQ